jgi:hypothetical protein
VTAMTPAGRPAVAFIPGRVIEEPASVAHLVYNTGTFPSLAAPGISEFFTSP